MSLRMIKSLRSFIDNDLKRLSDSIKKNIYHILNEFHMEDQENIINTVEQQKLDYVKISGWFLGDEYPTGKLYAKISIKYQTSDEKWIIKSICFENVEDHVEILLQIDHLIRLVKQHTNQEYRIIDKIEQVREKYLNVLKTTKRIENLKIILVGELLEEEIKANIQYDWESGWFEENK